MKRTKTKVLSVLLSLAMLLSFAVPTAFAADSRYADTINHWAEKAINRWSDYGIIKGYGETFNPDDAITRGQMATILSKTLGLTKEAENPFSDISGDDWYAPYILRCCKEGIILGDNGIVNPNAEITRQEAMTMFCRAFLIEQSESADLSDFKDSNDVAAWALPYVSALINSGIVSGVSDDMLAPNDSMSRAALVTILDRAVVRYINASGEYDLNDGSGIILVAAGDVILRGKTKADVLVTAAADGKTVTFSETTVAGNVILQANTEIIISEENSTNNEKEPETSVSVIPNKSLFIGNSLLVGFDEYGMSATDARHDYFYHISNYMKTTTKKLSGFRWESPKEWVASKGDEALTEYQEAWVDTYITDNPEVSDDLDMIVIQLGDNIDSDKQNVFEESSYYLLNSIRQKAPNARVIWLGCWYHHENVPTIIENCKKTGCTFIDIRDLFSEENQSEVGTIYTYDNDITRNYSNIDTCADNGNNTITVSYTADEKTYSTTVSCSSYTYDDTNKTLSLTGKQHFVNLKSVATHPGNKGFAAIANRFLYRSGIADSENVIAYE